MLTIPAGETMTYGQVAVSIGNPKAVRAVGAACGANPIPLLIPCHRIIGSNGNIGGYSGRGGANYKKKLLEKKLKKNRDKKK